MPGKKKVAVQVERKVQKTESPEVTRKPEPSSASARKSKVIRALRKLHPMD